MAITVRRHLIDLRQLKLTNRQDMAAVGQFILGRIRDRTSRGVDAKGQPFASYSDGYDKAKRKALRSSGDVNLEVSGEMLRNMTFEATDNKVTLFFAR